MQNLDFYLDRAWKGGSNEHKIIPIGPTVQKIMHIKEIQFYRGMKNAKNTDFEIHGKFRFFSEPIVLHLDS